jgi:hypothetical protein
MRQDARLISISPTAMYWLNGSTNHTINMTGPAPLRPFEFEFSHQPCLSE